MATGDWGEEASANLAQIGRHLLAPVASPSGRWGDMATGPETSESVATGTCTGFAYTRNSMLVAARNHGDESPSRNSPPNQPTNHMASRSVSVSELCYPPIRAHAIYVCIVCHKDAGL